MTVISHSRRIASGWTAICGQARDRRISVHLRRLAAGKASPSQLGDLQAQVQQSRRVLLADAAYLAHGYREFASCCPIPCLEIATWPVVPSSYGRSLCQRP